MDFVSIHLALNHLPIFAAFGGAVLLALGWVFRSAPYTRLGLVVFILGALGSAVVSTSGEEARETVEKLPRFEKNYLDQHEEMAETAATGAYILGGLALIALGVTRKKEGISRDVRLVAPLGVGAVVVLLLCAQAGHYGGQIAHPEIRSGTPPAPEAADED